MRFISKFIKRGFYGVACGNVNSKVHFDVTVGSYANTIIDFYFSIEELAGKDRLRKIIGVYITAFKKHIKSQANTTLIFLI